MIPNQLLVPGILIASGAFLFMRLGRKRTVMVPPRARSGGSGSPLLWLIVLAVVLYFLWPHLGTMLPALMKQFSTITHASSSIVQRTTSHMTAVVHSSSSYVTLARQDALSAGIDPDQFVRQINEESGFNPTIVSPKGAIGIAQIMPETAKGWNVNPWNAVDSLQAAAVHMAAYARAYGGNQAMALAAYNAGTGGVESAVRACGTNWQACLPQETQAYIHVILD
jgi:Transglycosylase SLT domain